MVSRILWWFLFVGYLSALCSNTAMLMCDRLNLGVSESHSIDFPKNHLREKQWITRNHQAKTLSWDLLSKDIFIRIHHFFLRSHGSASTLVVVPMKSTSQNLQWESDDLDSLKVWGATFLGK